MNAPLHIVAGIRTPFCKMGGDLAACDAVELGRTAASALLARTGLDPGLIDEVIFGCVGQPIDAVNLTRVIALRAGVPARVPAMTVHRNCASGFESLTTAADRIAAGRGDIYLVGGVESMSRYPLLFPESAAKKFAALARTKSLAQKIAALARFRPSDFSPRVSLMLGLTDPVCGLNMGQTAELLARDFSISREAQDAFALRSHLRAAAAREKLAAETTPVYPPSSKPSAVTADNGIREAQTLEALQKLRAIFDRLGGTVTAGNASQVTDGACALLVMSEAGLRRTGLSPLGRLVGHAYAGCDPSRMGLGPVFAIAKARDLTGLTLADADIIELNEAFAAQVLACQAAARSPDHGLGEIRDDILNVNGGAIALGHPVGATGARLVLTALHELHRRRARRALVTLCIGGGQGGALWLEAAS